MLVQERQAAHYVQRDVLAVVPPAQAGELAVGGVQRFEQVAALGRDGQETGSILGWLSGMRAQGAGTNCTLKLNIN